MSTGPRASRVHYSARNRILPRAPKTVAPAWREQQRARQSQRGSHNNAASVSLRDAELHAKEVLPPAPGGTIFIEQLPPDVTQQDVFNLCDHTIGPVTDCYLLYNNQTIFKGMAVVNFARPSDALKARQKYHGQVVDGRRPLRIRVVVDHDINPERPTSGPLATLSTVAPQSAPQQQSASKPTKNASLRSRIDMSASLLGRLGPLPAAAAKPTQAPALVPVTSAVPAQQSKRAKKGPKRTAEQKARKAQAVLATQAQEKKQQTKKRKGALTAETLDKEMDEWRTAELSLAHSV